MKKWVLAGIMLLLIMSCTVPNKLYKWDDYQKVLANYTERPGNATSLALQESIQRVMSESAINKKKVPPGIYIQYGYLLAQDGHTEKARQYYELEKSVYPESEKLVNELIARLK